MNKQTGVNFIAQVIAFGINLCISFFLTPFIIKNIGVEANGFVTLATTFVDYAHLITVAVNSMASRFITIKIHQKNIKDANRYFTSVVFANLIMSMVFTLVISVVIVFLDKFLDISQSSVSDIKLLWTFIALNFVLSLFTSIFAVSTFAADRLDKTALCNARGSIIRAAALVICYKFFTPYTFFVGIATLLVGLHNLVSHIYYKAKFAPELKVKRKYFDFSCIKELVSSGIWNSVTQLSTILSSGLDLLITNIFVNGVAMGILNISKTVSNTLLALFGNLTFALAPQVTITYAKDDPNGLRQQLLSAVKLFGMCSSIPIAILIGFGKDFFRLWVPTQNSSLLYFLAAITCLQLTFTLPLEPLCNIFTACNKIKTSSIALICFSTASVLTVFIGLSFITREDTKIIFIASVGAFYNILRALTFLPIYGAKCLNLKLNTFYPVILKNLLSAIFLSMIAIALNNIIKVDSWMLLLSCCAIVGLLGIVINILVLFNRQEICNFKNIANDFIEKRIKKSN